MAKVYGLHTLDLKPGVDAHEFETFVTQELNPILNQIPGEVISILKGDRGARAGQYLLLFEVDSVERRDYLHPLSGEDSAEMQRFETEHGATLAKLGTFVVAVPDPNFTDYATVE